jgi:hypothetical protein
MGHDARFRGVLARALVRAGWDAPAVDWFDSPTHSTSLSVRDALSRVASLLDRDWTEKVERAASRARPVRSAALVGSATPEDDGQPIRDFAGERIEALMDRLESVPLTGQWGWYRAPENRSVRYSARVHATFRRLESDRIDLLVVCADGSRRVVEGVDRVCWFHDEDAKV